MSTTSIRQWMLGTGLATALLFGMAGCESGGFLWWDDEDNAAKAQAEPIDEQARMQQWMAFGAPGPQHDWLRQFEGIWTVSGSMMMTPDSHPMPFSGTSTFTMILDGHYLKEHNVSDDADMPFEGLGYMGYDHAKKKYVASWMDSMSTSIMQADGSIDETTGKLLTTGTYYDPTRGAYVTMQGETWFVDDDTIQADMYQPGPDGKPFKSMSMQYRRK